MYFDSFEIEHILQQLSDKIKGNAITHNIFTIQDDSIMCRLYCIGFTEYMNSGKTLLDYTSLFHINDSIRNDKIIHNCFKDKHSKH